VTHLVARMAWETGISPLDLLEVPPEVFDEMLRVRDEIARQQKGR
jgi:hypothetical protein